MPGKEPLSPIAIVSVWAGLMLLLTITAASALIPLGTFNALVNYAASFAKTFLVAAFFMHLHARSNLLRSVALAGALWLALLISLSLADYLTRVDIAPPW